MSTETETLTPTWVATVRILCLVLQNPQADDHAKMDAESELLRLASWADRQMSKENDDE